MKGKFRRFRLGLVLLCALLFVGCGFSPEGVLIQGGTFVMGDAAGQGEPNERPAHPTTVSDFWMAKTEVTQKLWGQVMHTVRTDFPGELMPVDQVGFAEACEFCNRLSRAEGLAPAYRIQGLNVEWDRSSPGYRLPTEAEWEFAARGGLLSRGFQFAGSNQAEAVAWTTENTGASPRPVAEKAPNELGLFDLSGNVWEWCWDWFATYPATAQVDPAGPAVGEIHPAQGSSPTIGPMRVGRGGGWSMNATFARVTARYFAPDYRGWVNGIRLVRTAPKRA
jgi:formylglycine-generating enzyme required for sulfatase activity